MQFDAAKTAQDFIHRPDRWFYLFICVIVIALYGNTISYEFNLDDQYVTYLDPLVGEGVSAIPEIFQTNFIDTENRSFGYRPLSKASFAIEASLWGEIPEISHGINVILFLLGCWILWGLVGFLFPDLPPFFRFSMVLLFATHPIHSEVVASLKNRDELLAQLFLFCSFLMAFQYVNRSKNKFLIASWGCFLLALLSKISILPYCVLMPAVCFIQKKPLRQSIIHSSGILIISAIFVFAITQYLPGYFRTFTFVENPIPFLDSISEQIGTGLAGLRMYARLLMIPHSLSFYYGYSAIPIQGLTHPSAIFTLIGLSGLIAFGIYSLIKRKPIAIAIGFLLLPMSIYSNFIVHIAGIVVERGLHTAVLGFAMLLVYAVYGFFNKNINRIPTLSMVIIFVTAIIYSGLTIQNNRHWKDHFQLYLHGVKMYPQSAMAQEILANLIRSEYIQAGTVTNEKINLAIQHHLASIDAYGEWDLPWYRLGLIHAVDLNQPKTSIGYFKNACKFNPHFSKSRYNLAKAYEVLGDKDSARYYYEEAISIKPSHEKALNSLIQLYFFDYQLYSEAERLNKLLLQYYPESEKAFVNAGNFAIQKGDMTEAARFFETALSFDPTNQNVASFLIQYYQSIGNEAAIQRIRSSASKE